MEQKKRRVKKSPEELQKLAMIKYKQQLRKHKTKIVKHAPQTELEKPVVIKTINAITEKQDSHMDAGVNKKKDNTQRKCIKCNTNIVWLEHNMCYECYMRKIDNSANKKHFIGVKLNCVVREDTWEKENEIIPRFKKKKKKRKQKKDNFYK